ncbi:expressed unknown protein [Seminavis robusta]|uniref:Uncharacterized protein n=1 Tax=Seminavis robusta TaxID=568900 RepID=A0A9N8ELG0_9STRA|nr:expressed unknown protein [Seminavis robusta]|eukprot:Sro1175_g249210.1 n/a (251) ;mRNA; f:30942-31694
MGCSISILELEQNGIIADILPTGEFVQVDSGNTVTFFCRQEGATLLDGFDYPVPNGVYQYHCPEGLDDYTFSHIQETLRCQGPPTESPTSAPTTIAPTSAPTTSSAPSVAPTTAHPTTLAPSAIPTTLAPHSDRISTPSGCIIPAMAGIQGFQAASSPDQVEIVRFPISKSNGSEYYTLHPHDTIIFACEQDSQRMKINGEALEPRSVNFYPYTCLVDGCGEQEANIDLSLTCEDRGTLRRLGSSRVVMH